MSEEKTQEEQLKEAAREVLNHVNDPYARKLALLVLNVPEMWPLRPLACMEPGCGKLFPVERSLPTYWIQWPECIRCPEHAKK